MIESAARGTALVMWMVNQHRMSLWYNTRGLTVDNERRHELIELHGDVTRHRAKWLGTTLAFLLSLGVYATFEWITGGYTILAILLTVMAFVVWWWGRWDDKFVSALERIERKLEGKQ